MRLRFCLQHGRRNQPLGIGALQALVNIGSGWPRE
jgi:hypothetical protein